MCLDFFNRELYPQFLSSANVQTKCTFVWNRMLALLVKQSRGDANKIYMLDKVLGIVAGVLLRDHEVMHTALKQVSYHKIFIGLFLELSAEEPILENISLEVLTTF
ncbi:hypothetical protein CHS0354_012204 [Potamilus streckersoni]|nr:hypothetical protein CHS0354_012204 [Potamilus streckersoni]